MIYLFPLYSYVISEIDYHITINQKQLHRWVLVWNLTPRKTGQMTRAPRVAFDPVHALVILRLRLTMLDLTLYLETLSKFL